MDRLKNDKSLEEVMMKYNYALETLETDLNILIKDYEFRNNNNPIEHIKSRLKSKESALKKLEKKGYDLTVENLVKYVHDMIGVRIVCSFLSDVYNIVELIKRCKKFKIREEKDYISTPKETGYISYHLIVLVPIVLGETEEYVEAEIQIRTIAMDFWASLDHKIQYKFQKQIPDEIKEEMLNCALDIRMLDNKMGRINEIMKKYNSNN